MKTRETDERFREAAEKMKFETAPEAAQSCPLGAAGRVIVVHCIVKGVQKGISSASVHLALPTARRLLLFMVSKLQNCAVQLAAKLHLCRSIVRDDDGNMKTPTKCFPSLVLYFCLAAEYVEERCG